MKLVIPVFLAAIWFSPVAAEPLPCIAASDAIRANVPGYNNELGTKQPPAIAAIDACLRKRRVCLLLKSGKVVSGNGESDVFVGERSVVFGIVQTLRTKSRAYCAIATLVPEIGGDMLWAYRTFTPNGGWIGEEINDPSTQPKSSRELHEKLAENFQAFQTKARLVLSEPSAKDGEYGYRKGEEP